MSRFRIFQTVVAWTDGFMAGAFDPKLQMPGQGRRNCEARTRKKSAEILESRSVVAREITRMSLISREFTKAVRVAIAKIRRKRQPWIAVVRSHHLLIEPSRSI